MTGITHHVPENLLRDYVSGQLPQPFALAVAAHISMCPHCRAIAEAHAQMGGVVLQDLPETPVSHGLKGALFDRLNEAPVLRPDPQGPYPTPVVEALGGTRPKWQRMGLGSRQAILSASKAGSARLLYIPPGQAVPEHSHGGLELTLVLQGAFRDETGRFGPGDIEVAGDDLDHKPIAEDGEACICLAATDAPLQFQSAMVRMLQPIFRI